MHSVLITGATSGLGLETAHQLGELGYKVYLGCRNADKAKRTLAYLNAKNDEAQFVPFVWDMTSIASLPEALKILDEPVDYLILNAGILPPKQMTNVETGEEQTFYVNHLAHFALVQALWSQGVLPKKILVVSSAAHQPSKTKGFFPKPEFESVENFAFPPKPNSSKLRYVHSKLCNTLFGLHLHTLHSSNSHTDVLLYNPGFITNTQLGRHTSTLNKVLSSKILPLIKRWMPEMISLTDSAKWLIHWLDNGKSGSYYSQDKLSAPSELAQNKVLQEKLWAFSQSLLSNYKFLI